MAKQLEQYFRTTLASIADAVVSIDLLGRVVFANKVALSILRTAEHEILGKHFEDVFRIHNEYTGAKVENPLRRVLEEGSTVGLANHTILTAWDGTQTPIDDSAAPIRDNEGEITGAVIVFRDITERRQGEAASGLLASIVESSNDAIISKDLNGTITSWNRAAERIFGYSPEEAIGRPISMIAAPERVDEMPGILERIRNGERIGHYETVRQARDGRRLHISLTVSPVRNREGQIVGASKVARDITEQVRVRTQLAEERERLRVTLSSIGDAVIATDRNGLVSYLNPVAEELTGWESASAAGKSLTEVFRIVNEQTRSAVENPVEKVIAKGLVVGLANHTILIARDGRERAIDDSAAPIRDDGGNIVGVVLVFRDVSEKRTAENQLEQQASELRRTNDELSQFAYAVSHDLREPLRNVANFSELMVREYAGRSETRTYANYVVNGVRRMETLLNDLLAYSQAGGPSDTPPTLVNTHQVLQKTLADLRSAIADSGAEITADRLPDVQGHEAQLSQIFQNLISNAIKYCSDQPPRIRIRAERNEDGWTFRVRDNGVGIAREYHETIFRVFKRLHGNDIPGTGIGLAICAKVVDRHGGRMWVESKPGEGAEFFFTLPGPYAGRAAET
ncbi:MAG: PAS domain S-box protein [Bryobacteraceae bacterium]